jgi:hypothetical protein
MFTSVELGELIEKLHTARRTATSIAAMGVVHSKDEVANAARMAAEKIDALLAALVRLR